ncbi:MAG: hypothetical protein K0Q72_3778 [Armatimonadetes bacterium]|nr:hypothetical protein [Armatimonadota bacterium]
MSSGTIDGSAPAAVGRRERKAAETRDRIFQAAIELFACRGLSNVTVEQFGAVQVERLDEARSRGEISGSPREQILQILQLLATHPALTSDLARAMLVAHLHLGTAARQHAPSVWQVTKVIAESIRAGQEDGTFTTTAGADELALWIMGQFFLAQLTCCTGYADLPFPDLTHRYISLALDALCAGS